MLHMAAIERVCSPAQNVGKKWVSRVVDLEIKSDLQWTLNQQERSLQC